MWLEPLRTVPVYWRLWTYETWNFERGRIGDEKN